MSQTSLVKARRAQENRAYVRKLLRQRQPGFAAALASAERQFSAAARDPRGQDGTVMSGTSPLALARRAAALADPLPCRRDPELWFSASPSGLELARASCLPCPLRAECLAGAIERAEPWGVWGGEIFDDGTIIAAKRRRGRPPRHLREVATRSALSRKGAAAG
jgi:WhiB family transcriptional regulator, redox-sensing transcriptional regulator